MAQWILAQSMLSSCLALSGVCISRGTEAIALLHSLTLNTTAALAWH